MHLVKLNVLFNQTRERVLGVKHTLYSQVAALLGERVIKVKNEGLWDKNYSDWVNMFVLL